MTCIVLMQELEFYMPYYYTKVELGKAMWSLAPHFGLTVNPSRYREQVYHPGGS